MLEITSDNPESGQTIVRTSVDGVSLDKFAPSVDWRKLAPGDHFAQFYETESFLLNSLQSYATIGLATGEAVIIVGTSSHLERLQQLLAMGGVDVATTINSGQLTLLDASETLEKFLVGSIPDSAQFEQTVGPIISEKASKFPRVRIFGEMVALLWRDGNYAGAITLEGFWNHLQQKYSFSLFCGYPISTAANEEFTHVCSEHTYVIPAESYVSLNNPDDRMKAIIRLQQHASLLQAEIAERKQAEASLNQLRMQLELQAAEREQALAREQLLRAEAEAASCMKDEFLATVSHELRTPLNSIIGWCHMIRSGRLDGTTVTRALETIERNAKVQAQLVEDILDVSRVITGKLHLSTAPVDLSAVINSSIDAVQLAAESKNIQLEVTLSPVARFTIGDASRLQQVVWNLLSNAIKFTPHGGKVAVKLERAGDSVRIMISDSGQGISTEFLPFIFDRFRQADGTSTRRHGGLGLGLAIVRQLVELHGGTVSASSEGEGLGTTFTVELPLIVPERSRSSKRQTGSLPLPSVLESQPTSVPSLAGVRVLLVDDDQDTLHVLSVLLRESQAETETVSSVAEAMEVLKWYRPNVIVSDLAMPDEDGYSLIAKVRLLDSSNGNSGINSIPAIALTSYVRVEDRSRALAAGFNMFVPKPIQPNELINAIANLIEPSSKSS